MHFSASELDSATTYKLLVSTVLPRPIAFVTSVSPSGAVNAAPFSFFNAMGSQPPVVVIGFEPNADGSQKDTPTNILATQEFVVNMVDEPLAAQMNLCAANLAYNEDETVHAGLETTASLGVKAPRITASPVSFECTLLDYTELAGGGKVVIGEVAHFHLREGLVTSLDPLRVNIDGLAPIARLSGALYARTTDQFEISRPK